MTQLGALFNAGRYEAMEDLARMLIDENPRSGSAWKALGVALQMQGKDSLFALQKAAEMSPDDAEVHNNLGFTLTALWHSEDAVASCRRALQIRPNFAEAHNNLGNAYQNLGRLEDATASYRRALELKPNFAEAHNNLGNVLNDLGRLDEAMARYRRALELKPDFAEAYNNLGNALKDLGQFDVAMAHYRRVLELRPDFVEAHCNRGSVLIALGRLDDAMESFRTALEINPDFAEVHNNFGNALKDVGQLDEAVASYRRALVLEPDFAEAHSNLLFLYAYHASLTPFAYLAEARKWEQACVPEREREAARNRVFERAAPAGRRLKVGYVSGDYRKHPVSDNIEQLFAQHDRARIELYAYSASGFHDAVTERLQALAEHWVPVTGLSDAAARDRIDADGIDVLVDLSGHTASNRLGVFARRAAPVQVYYLGYFASTGLTEMDYLIGDEILTPAETDSHFSERVWRLPRIWESYNNQKDAPAVGWRPAPEGGLWLGSFNNLGKLTPATLALWAKVLHALPQAKLLLKTKELADAGNRERILEALGGHGIDAGRIELRDWSVTPEWGSHMAYYDRLDIALDPVGGMGGGNTTCEALWMGVPVITLLGDRMSSRITATIVNAVGHAEWIARSEGEYIDKVMGLARDVEGRKVLRALQREQMAASPLCDARGLARLLEQAYARMFERWAHAKH